MADSYRELISAQLNSTERDTETQVLDTSKSVSINHKQIQKCVIHVIHTLICLSGHNQRGPQWSRPCGRLLVRPIVDGGFSPFSP